MQLIQQTFTQYYNKKYNRTGHVFEQRYKAILCNKDEYLLALIRYIHKNPEEAKISDINYKWSSHKEYIGNELGICDIYFPLSMFSDYREIAKKKYLEYVMDSNLEPVENMNYELMSEKAHNSIAKKKEEKRSIEDIIIELEKEYRINIEELMGRSKNRQISKVKNYFVKEVIRHGLMNQKELAEYLKITEMAVSKIVNKV